MIDQLIIGDVASYDDFEASVKERTITDGKKKEIKETVPFSNLTYDFSGINGEVYWEEKELEYIFEIIADSAEELEQKKIAFKSWVMNVSNETLYDPYILDYHFTATFKEIDVDDSEFEKSTISVVFTAFPYMIANRAKVYTIQFDTTANEEKTVTIQNDSSHRISPTFNSDINFTIGIENKISSYRYAVPAGKIKYEDIKFEVGENVVKVSGNGAVGAVTISFHEEVF